MLEFGKCFGDKKMFCLHGQGDDATLEESVCFHASQKMQVPFSMSSISGSGGGSGGGLKLNEATQIGSDGFRNGKTHTMIIELKDVNLVNTISFGPDMARFWHFCPKRFVGHSYFSYKIQISKDNEIWNTLFDFREMDCYFDQILKFPTQAVRYVHMYTLYSGACTFYG